MLADRDDQSLFFFKKLILIFCVKLKIVSLGLERFYVTKQISLSQDKFADDGSLGTT